MLYPGQCHAPAFFFNHWKFNENQWPKWAEMSRACMAKRGVSRAG